MKKVLGKKSSYVKGNAVEETIEINPTMVRELEETVDLVKRVFGDVINNFNGFVIEKDHVAVAIDRFQ